MNRPLATGAASQSGCSTASCPCARPCQSASDTSPLMQYGETIRFERGQRLWGQGDPADSVLAICTGAVKTVREWRDNKSMILNVRFRGGMVGAEAAIAGMRRASTCVALTNGRAVRIGVGTLRRVMKDDPSAVQTLLRSLALASEDFAHRLDETQLGPVEERLARVLIRVANEVGLLDSRGVFVPLALSRGDLAELIGCRVETVIRIMTRWQREEVLETRREGFVIRQRSVLEQAARQA